MLDTLNRMQALEATLQEMIKSNERLVAGMKTLIDDILNVEIETDPEAGE